PNRFSYLPLPLSFFFTDTAPTETYPLSLHDALPIFRTCVRPTEPDRPDWRRGADALPRPCSRALPPMPRWCAVPAWARTAHQRGDRKSTRLNSSHVEISYAVFCLKKKKNTKQNINTK